MDYTPINEYLNFLWSQLQYDWSIFTKPWILYTVIPAIGYLIFFVAKWYVLLAPITVPISVARMTSNDDNTRNDIRDQLSDRLK
jgi:hypothetical protein